MPKVANYKGKTSAVKNMIFLEFRSNMSLDIFKSLMVMFLG